MAVGCARKEAQNTVPIVDIMGPYEQSSVSPVPVPVQDVASGLNAFLKGDLPPKDLIVTFDDLHPLWGGLRLTVRGSGQVEQEAVRLDRSAVPPPVGMTQEQVRTLVRLLLDLRAWEQRVPDRSPQPDEQRTYVRITAGTAQSEVWEWHNDLALNDRLTKIGQVISDEAWNGAEDAGSSIRSWNR
jgi:hypothetical protein